jgi:hypothetical protein
MHILRCLPLGGVLILQMEWGLQQDIRAQSMGQNGLANILNAGHSVLHNICSVVA